VPFPDHRFPAVGGRLIEDGDGAGGTLPVLLRFAFLDFKRIEAASLHEQVLGAEHVADSSDLAPVTVAFPQPPGVGVRAAVLEHRERQRDDVKMLQIVGDVARRTVTLQPHADRVFALKTQSIEDTHIR